MPKQMLSGTLEEQCEFLYALGSQKMDQGNYTGAVHAFKEIVKYAPEFRDANELLAIAKQRKAEQRLLIISGIIGATLFIGIGTLLNLSNDLYLLALAFAGVIVGYSAGSIMNRRRKLRQNRLASKADRQQ